MILRFLNSVKGQDAERRLTMPLKIEVHSVLSSMFRTFSGTLALIENVSLVEGEKNSDVSSSRRAVMSMSIPIG